MSRPDPDRNRLVAGAFDGGRVDRYVRERGGVLVKRRWDPFGPGWFGGKDSRIYQIDYRDREGNLHRAHVKTSMLSGVYLTNDQTVKSARSAEPKKEQLLEEENRRLKEQITKLQKGHN
jgi:hypothetical protein